ncbi:hypothetical protein [Hamadaea tsunoensis]|uniref:hypothetical protein n=1 Tax=Hamadaea tsunoensis TaxID=53368 RepID=UPI0004003B39|nr:hypothetical protein [Hamadaea tsunoensis]
MTTSVLRRAAGIAAAVVFAAAAVVMGVTGPAYASSWVYSDNMEIRAGNNGPENRFFFEAGGGNEYGIFQNLAGTSVGTHSGSYAAKLNHLWDQPTWVSVGQTITVGPKALGHPTWCRFSAWVRANGNDRYNIEVIDPTTWNYIAVSQVAQPVANTWSQISTVQFAVPVTNVVLRVSFLPPAYTDAAFVDDFMLSCTL